MRVLATSTAAEARLAFCTRELDQLAPEEEILIVGPTRGATDDFVRSYAMGAGRLGFHRYTPLQLAFEISISQLAARGLTTISGVALEALTIRTAHLAAREGSLIYFSEVADTKGFRWALGRTLAELRGEGIRPDELHGAGPSGHDLAILLERYENELTQGRMADPAAVYDLAAGSASAPTRFGGKPVLLIDVVPNNAREADFLTAVVAAASDAIAVALPQEGKGLERLEQVLGRTAEALEEAPRFDSLFRLRQYVFGLDAPSRAEADQSVLFFSATDEGRECVEITRYIQYAASLGTPFDQMAVLVRNPDLYEPLIQEALVRGGIPGYYTSGSVRPNPSGRAFLALLICRSEGLSATRFAEYLSLGQVPRLDADGSSPRIEPAWKAAQGELFPDGAVGTAGRSGDPASEPESVPEDSPTIAGDLRAPFAWERLIVDAAVIGGSVRWRTRLAGFDQELRRQIEEAGSDQEARQAYLTDQRAQLGHLRRFALPVIELLEGLPVAALWREWRSHLEILAGHTLGRPDQVLSVLAELRGLDEVGPVNLDEVLQVLTERLALLRAEPEDRRYGKVFVGTVAEAAGRVFDIVFLPGVSEGVFPRKIQEDPLLLDAYRKQIGDRLSIAEDRSRRERLLLHIAAGAARTRLFVSYPRMDLGQGRGRVPSFYALEVLRAAEGHVPSLSELERRATAESMSRLGWPSPKDPGQAIDDAEYDLATIGNLIDRSSLDAPGAGYYLLDANASLARSLRARARRWRNFWSEADGIVAPEAPVLGILADHRLSSRTYSPTALQQFAVCPYRFLLSAIHRLHPRQEAAQLERLDPLTRGSLFHAVQFRLLTELKSAGTLPVEPANLAEVSRVADRVLDNTAREYETELAPAISRVWQSEIEKLRTDLRGWLRAQAQLTNETPKWIPKYFEFSFGLDASGDHDPASRSEAAVILDGSRLRGSVDLIEEDASDQLLRVVDHKTGRASSPEPAPTGGGEVLQPMLYALAVEKLIDQRVRSTGLFFCTERGDYRRIEMPVNTESRQHVGRALALIDASIRDGFLPAAPRPGACAYCDYRVVCGPYEELRTRRKIPGRKKPQIERIEQLRQIP